MKKLAILSLPVLLVFIGCASDKANVGADGTVPPPTTPGGQVITTGTDVQPPTNPQLEQQAQGQVQDSGTTIQPKPWSQPVTTQSTTETKYPVATPVAGKPGIVRSPYAPYAGDVDVRGFSSGQQVRCPYTGKIFVVP